MEKLLTKSDSEPGVVVFGAIVFEESFSGFKDGRERDGMMIGVLVCDGGGDIRPHAFVFEAVSEEVHGILAAFTTMRSNLRFEE